MILYRAAQRIVRTFWPAVIGPVHLQGLENVPRTGPFILVANHQSIVDPILIQSYCPRPLRTMAKSTQFSSPLFAWLMPRMLSFPVRRFEIDPQAVRLVLRYLREGEPVGIYLEGERSWDGRLQPFRRGTVRVILKAGVPVVPCRIDGTYDVWPRWHRGLRRAAVRITYGAAIDLGRHDTRAEREARLADAIRTLRTALDRPETGPPTGARSPARPRGDRAPLAGRG